MSKSAAVSAEGRGGSRSRLGFSVSGLRQTHPSEHLCLKPQSLSTLLPPLHLLPLYPHEVDSAPKPVPMLIPFSPFSLPPLNQAFIIST